MFDPKPYIRTVPDWPQSGVQFRDITTLLSDPIVFRQVIDAFAEHYREVDFDVVVGIDARGFIFGAALAYALKKAFVPIRKKGKLPFDTIEESYALEYGQAEIQIHSDAMVSGQRAIVIDDLIATGGTLDAACNLIQRIGGVVVECAAVVDLPELGGSLRVKNKDIRVFVLCQFEGH